MRRSPSSALVVLLGCGPGQVFHKDPEQPCKHIALAGQDDVAAAAGCSSIDSLTLRTGMALDLAPLGRLRTIRGAVVIGPSVGFVELTLPSLRSVGTVRIVGNGNLQGIFLPRLEHAASFEVDGNAALTTISVPKLALIDHKLAITGNANLEMLDLTALATAGEVVLATNPKLTVIEGTLPALQGARDPSSSKNDPPPDSQPP
jgi:hypothetical protein